VGLTDEEIFDMVLAAAARCFFSQSSRCHGYRARSWDGTARLWDPTTGEPVGEPLTGHTDAVTSVAFGADADGRPLLASASWERTVRLWDPPPPPSPSGNRSPATPTS
jgi:WD40 repeat protein